MAAKIRLTVAGAAIAVISAVLIGRLLFRKKKPREEKAGTAASKSGDAIERPPPVLMTDKMPKGAATLLKTRVWIGEYTGKKVGFLRDGAEVGSGTMCIDERRGILYVVDDRSVCKINRVETIDPSTKLEMFKSIPAFALYPPELLTMFLSYADPYPTMTTLCVLGQQTTIVHRCYGLSVDSESGDLFCAFPLKIVRISHHTGQITAVLSGAFSPAGSIARSQYGDILFADYFEYQMYQVNKHGKKAVALPLSLRGVPREAPNVICIQQGLDSDIYVLYAGLLWVGDKYHWKHTITVPNSRECESMVWYQNHLLLILPPGFLVAVNPENGDCSISPTSLSPLNSA